MRYNPLPSFFYVINRKSFMEKMNENSVAIFNSNDIYPISADSTFKFQQHRDIFYLCGIDQAETILLLFPDSKDNKLKEILFIKETNPEIKIWEGEKLSKKEAMELSGVKTIYFLESFEKVFLKICSKCTSIYWNTNEHPRAKNETQTREDRFIHEYKPKFPKHLHEKSNPILHDLRSIKNNAEVNQIKNACDITKKGFVRVLNFVKPNVWEYEIEAEFIHEFVKNKSSGFAYEPIIASGKNSNVLHYNTNNNMCKSGEMILIDVGAEYGNYSSDMTRTIPVSGKFSSRQKLVYQSVLNVKNETEKLLINGNSIKDLNSNAGEIMTEELVKLGLLKIKDIKNQNPKAPLYKKYFMHGISHHIGLDTHDYGFIEKKIEPNMVFTIEPGIYIPDEGFGVRLEDVYLVNKNSLPTNLMKSIPIEIEEIEEIMNS